MFFLNESQFNETSALPDTLLFDAVNESLSYKVVVNVDNEDISIYLSEFLSDLRCYSFPVHAKPRCREVEFYMTALMSGAVCVIGLLGALFSFFGLRRDRSMSPAASFMLMALACADAVQLSSWLLTLSIPALLFYIGIDQSVSAVWLILYRAVGHGMLFLGQTTVVWLTALVAVGRWVTIRFPYRAAVQGNSQKTVVRAAVAGVVLVSLAFNLPRFFRYRPIIYSKVDHCNVTHYSLDMTQMVKYDSYKFVYAQVLYSTVNFGIPYALLTVFSGLLIATYRAQCRRREAILHPKQQHQHSDQQQLQQQQQPMNQGGSSSSEHRRSHENERSTTLVVVAVVVTFGVCNLPAKILLTFGKSVWLTDCEHPSYIARRLFNILELANSIGNFIVYCALRRQFRQALLNIGGRKRYNVALPEKSHQPRRPEVPPLKPTAETEVVEIREIEQH